VRVGEVTLGLDDKLPVFKMSQVGSKNLLKHTGFCFDQICFNFHLGRLNGCYVKDTLN
jgi:hypothetical protein